MRWWEWPIQIAMFLVMCVAIIPLAIIDWLIHD